MEKKLISNIIFELLVYMSEKKRLKIKQRQAEGIKSLNKKNEGKRIGRTRAEYPKDFEKYYKEWKSEKITVVKAMGLLGLKKNAFYQVSQAV